jgi:hypothetical protein
MACRPSQNYSNKYYKISVKVWFIHMLHKAVHQGRILLNIEGHCVMNSKGVVMQPF